MAAAAFLKFEAAVRGRLAGASLQVEMRLLRGWLRRRLRLRRRRLRGRRLGLELVKGAPRSGATLQGCRQVLLPPRRSGRGSWRPRIPALWRQPTGKLC